MCTCTQTVHLSLPQFVWQDDGALLVHVIPQNFSEGVIENMRKGVVWQNALPPLLVSVADDFVPYGKRPLGMPHMQHKPSCHLHTCTGGSLTNAQS